MTKTYATLAEVVAAVKDGSWPEGTELEIDNDSTYAYSGEERITTWARKGPYQLLDDALDLLGVPHRSA